jgi:trimeric autotransporter adhesin
MCRETPSAPLILQPAIPMKLRHSLLSVVALLMWAQAASAEIVLGVGHARADRSSAASADFTVRRSGDTRAAVSFTYATRDGTARAGRDYTATSGSATIPAGQTDVLVSVPLVAGSSASQARKFELLIASPTVPGIDPNQVTVSGAGAFRVGSSTEGSAAADFNGDGQLDAAFSAGGTVVVLRNATPASAGAARFVEAARVPASFGRLRVADLNRDGKPDIVVADNDTNRLTVLVNTTPAGSAGGFTFVATPVTTVGYGFTSDVAFADFDGDGVVDIVASSPGIDPAVGTARALVLRNTTPQGASAPVLSLVAQPPVGPAGMVARSVAAGDFNGDGRPDIAIDAGGVSILLNTTAAGAAAPSFAAAVHFAGVTGANEMAVADFNRDGRLDIVTANSNGWTGFTWSVLRNSTARGASVPSFKRTEFLGGAHYGVAAADMDGDGFADVVLTNLAGTPSNGGTVEIHRNLGVTTGAPSFSTVAQTSAGDEPHTVSVGDFNGDGWLDFVSIDFVGNSAGFEFRRPAALQPRVARAVATGTIVP